MSFMFNRFPRPSRHVIFYAREAALNMGAAQIDSTHLLRGLMLEDSSRANSVFRLAELFPQEAAEVRKMQRAHEQKDIPLAKEGKRILRLAEDEADRQDCYWIDTDHLTLGVLRESKCQAAVKLTGSGLGIEEARNRVINSSGERQSYGAIPALWWLSKPITRVGRFAGIMYLILIVVLIKLLNGRGC